MTRPNVSAGYFRSGLPFNRFGEGSRIAVIFQGLMFEHKPLTGLSAPLMTGMYSYPGMGHPAMGKPFERDVLAFLVERDPPSTDAEHDTVATSIPERRPCIGVGAYVCGSPLRMGARGGPISSP